MGQFDTLTIAERKSLVEAWSSACKAEGLYFIAHVGTTVVGEAIELAKHAAAAGADAIASVPPYYETTSDADTIVDWLEPICDAAPGLPLYYYHIPGSTHLGDPLGPPRLPQRPLSDESWRALQPKLDALDFWKRAAP